MTLYLKTIQEKGLPPKEARPAAGEITATTIIENVIAGNESYVWLKARSAVYLLLGDRAGAKKRINERKPRGRSLNCDPAPW